MIPVQTCSVYTGPNLGSPGNSSVVHRVVQNRNLEYGERRCGFDRKHQSYTKTRTNTKAPSERTQGTIHRIPDPWVLDPRPKTTCASLLPEWRGIKGLVALPHHPAKIPEMSGDIRSAETLRLFAWCQAVPEADLLMEDWGAGVTRQIWHQRAGGRAFHHFMRAWRVASDCGEDHRRPVSASSATWGPTGIRLLLFR